MNKAEKIEQLKIEQLFKLSNKPNQSLWINYSLRYWCILIGS